MTFANRNSRYANVELKLEESKVKNRNWFESFDRKLFIEDPLGRRPEFTWPGDSSNNYSPPEHSKFAKIPSERAFEPARRTRWTHCSLNSINTALTPNHLSAPSQVVCSQAVSVRWPVGSSPGLRTQPLKILKLKIPIFPSSSNPNSGDSFYWLKLFFFLSIFSCMNGEWAAILLNGEIEFKAKVSSHDCQPCTRLPNENFLLLPTGDHRL